MLGYVTIGVSDMPKAESFYNALLAEMGGKQLMGMDRIKFYGTAPNAAMLSICIPFNKEDPEPGNGTMAAFPGGDAEGVKALYQKAIELGATCDGEPGPRNDFFYGAYVKDADGNKLCFYHMSL